MEPAFPDRVERPIANAQKLTGRAGQADSGNKAADRGANHCLPSPRWPETALARAVNMTTNLMILSGCNGGQSTNPAAQNGQSRRCLPPVSDATVRCRDVRTVLGVLPNKSVSPHYGCLGSHHSSIEIAWQRGGVYIDD